MPFSVNHLMLLSSSSLYFSNHSIRDTEECNLTCYNLANFQIKEKNHLSRAKYFKVSVFLGVLRKYQKILQAHLPGLNCPPN